MQNGKLHKNNMKTLQSIISEQQEKVKELFGGGEAYKIVMGNFSYAAIAQILDKTIHSAVKEVVKELALVPPGWAYGAEVGMAQVFNEYLTNRSRELGIEL